MIHWQHQGEETDYMAEGKGDWGEAVGFGVKDDKVIYVGIDYF